MNRKEKLKQFIEQKRAKKNQKTKKNSLKYEYFSLTWLFWVLGAYSWQQLYDSTSQLSEYHELKELCDSEDSFGIEFVRKGSFAFVLFKQKRKFCSCQHRQKKISPIITTPAFSLQISSAIKLKKLNIIEKIRWKMLAVRNWLGWALWMDDIH